MTAHRLTLGDLKGSEPQNWRTNKMDGIRHATMNDGWDGPESDEWANNLAILPTFDRPEHVSWANRDRPTTPPKDPWNSPIDEFIDYLTGTSSAPVVVTMPRADMDPWE